MALGNAISPKAQASASASAPRRAEGRVAHRPFGVLCRAFPCLRSRQRHAGRSLALLAFKWLAPAMLNALCMFICAWLLHVATYFYVQEMRQWTEDYQLRNASHHRRIPLTQGLRETDVSFGSLNDVVEQSLGYANVSIHQLDAIALLFPAGFVLLAVLLDDLQTWTKVLTCNALLALLKGLVGWMTTVPDSAGWAECQRRLGEPGLRWMEEPHSYLELIKLEMFGLNGHHLRWCADMMYSGHTYLTTLYALGLYELLRITTRDADRQCFSGDDGAVASMPSRAPFWTPLRRMLLLTAVGCLAVGEQAVEVWCVLRSHFHYSSDVFLAIVLTFLFYSNGAIAVYSKWWAGLGTIHWSLLQSSAQSARSARRARLELQAARKEALRSCGMLLTEFRSLCEANQIVFHSDGLHRMRAAQAGAEQAIQDANVAERYAEISAKEDDFEHRLEASGGDVFLPPCCLPFCCLAGRQHILHDATLEELLQRSDISADGLSRIKRSSMIGEGVDLADCGSIFLHRTASARICDGSAPALPAEAHDMYAALV